MQINSQTFVRKQSSGFVFIKIICNLLVYGLAITYIFPFVWMAYTSFKTKAEFTANIFLPSSNPTIENFKQAMNQKSGVYISFFNSILITLASICAIVFLAFIVAYLLNRYKFNGRGMLYGFFIASIFIPIHSLMVPLYIQYNTLGILNTRIGLILPYITLGLPIAIFLFNSYLASLSKAIDEAAMIDGCTLLQTMFHIVFPICAPANGTVIILSVMNIWNEFPFALVLTSSPNMRTVPLWLRTFDAQYTSNITLKLTGLFIGCIPIIIAFLACRDKIMSGVAAGALKGE